MNILLCLTPPSALFPVYILSSLLFILTVVSGTTVSKSIPPTLWSKSSSLQCTPNFFLPQEWELNSLLSIDLQVLTLHGKDEDVFVSRGISFASNYWIPNYSICGSYHSCFVRGSPRVLYFDKNTWSWWYFFKYANNNSQACCCVPAPGTIWTIFWAPSSEFHFWKNSMFLGTGLASEVVTINTK